MSLADIADILLHHHAAPDGCPHYEALIWQPPEAGPRIRTKSPPRIRTGCPALSRTADKITA